ncbi:glucokinase [Microcystis aeruginosa LEGE 00239]|uniref:glucokinase n=1 Tax=Microcystis aeruginosa TaxID=1126 RepID=UPI00187E40EC|nr:glucokinase [Microcystis aeruginosa]MBE9246279.1 glucokinase [Microcystis aeruginosa LEGE 00239]
MVILAGEIGKEKSNLALFSHKTLSKQTSIDSLIVSQIFTTKDYAKGLQNIVNDFLDRNYHGTITEDIYGACFGIAGPVDNGEATINYMDDLEVTFSEQHFKEKLPYQGVPVSFLNDMVAIGYGIFLGDGEKQLTELYPATDVDGPKDRRVLMLVTDGLGQALWLDSPGKKLVPVDSEGGHTDFSPRTPQDIELLNSSTLKEEKKKDKIPDQIPVSYEYILSKKGLVRIYGFIKKDSKDSPEEWKNQPDMENAEAIIEAAKTGNPLCKAALDQFIAIWGAQAGNLALTYKASGGVYIGGIDIPIEMLKEGNFRNAFINKEKNFKSYNEKVGIKVFQEKDIVLWGAARHAIEEGFVTKGKFAIMRANQ